MQRLLALGYSVRHIACSGARAGYEMLSADAFGDADTRECSSAFFFLNFSSQHLDLRHLEHLADAVDGVLVGSGLENAAFGKLAEKVLGNSPEKMREVANKAKLAERLADLGIPHPKTFTQETLSQARFPLIAKPLFGGGGVANFLCRNERELLNAARQGNLIFQEFIEGKIASVSVISTGKEAVSLCVNEQLAGLKSLFCEHPFTYCGNISPFKTKFADKMCEIAEFLVLELGLKGSNGVDFVVNDDGFFVLEVNPRFQGSLETVEHCTGLNVVSAHLKACEGELPPKQRGAEEKYAARLILFAERDCVVEADLRRFCGGNEEKMLEKGVGGGEERGREEGKEERSAGGWIADIPQRGRVLRRGEPVASGLGVARSREEAIKKAREVILCVRRNILCVRRNIFKSKKV
ncbi:MAG: ATP-grasp domain-containing protein [Candidatus Methanospirare jalkutatii]|nr:MAG: ATP-grasp domain-containing protein [Candidatus Methanospirare jalkutatii]